MIIIWSLKCIIWETKYLLYFFYLTITNVRHDRFLCNNNPKRWYAYDIELRLVRNVIVTYSVRHVVHLRGSVGVTWRPHASVLRIRVSCIFYGREKRDASKLAGIGVDTLRHANHITAVYCAFLRATSVIS